MNIADEYMSDLIKLKEHEDKISYSKKLLFTALDETNNKRFHIYDKRNHYWKRVMRDNGQRYIEHNKLKLDNGKLHYSTQVEKILIGEKCVVVKEVDGFLYLFDKSKEVK